MRADSAETREKPEVEVHDPSNFIGGLFGLYNDSQTKCYMMCVSLSPNVIGCLGMSGSLAGGDGVFNSRVAELWCLWHEVDVDELSPLSGVVTIGVSVADDLSALGIADFSGCMG